MLEVTLHFSAAQELSLHRLEFSGHSTIGKKISVRGRNERYGITGNFPWGTAVKGLTAVFLDSFLGLKPKDTSETRSLDFALGKPPTWLYEMFGSIDDSAFAKRLFIRTNPEGKRPGKVIVELNQNLISPDNIKILVDGTNVTVEKLQDLISLFSNSISKNDTELCNKLIQETTTVLNSNFTFNRNRYIQRLKYNYSDCTIQKVLPKNTALHHKFSEDIFPSDTLGITHFKNPFNRLLTIWSPLAQPAVFAFLNKWRNKNNISCEINNRFLHGVELVKKIILKDYESQPDILCFGVVASAFFMQNPASQEYIPIVQLPGCSHRMVGRVLSNKNKKFSLVSEDPNTTTMYLDKFTKANKLKSEVVFEDPSQAFTNLKSSDCDIISVAMGVYADIYTMSTGINYLDNPKNAENLGDSVLFMHRSIFKQLNEFQLRSFIGSIRNAVWETSKMDNQFLYDVFMKSQYHKLVQQAVGI